MLKDRNFGSRWLGLLLFVVLATSCKSGKIASDSGIDASLPVRTVIRNHYRNAPEFKTISGRVKVDYSDGESEQSVGVSLRMEKDKVIWMSAPLGVVKAYITPERVSFYNKLQNECFDGDFTYLSHLLGTDLNFEKVQNLLLGQALVDLREEKFDMEPNAGTYELKPRNVSALFKMLFRIEPRTYKVQTAMLSQPENKRLLQISYEDYGGKDFQLLPGTISILAAENEKQTRIKIEYRNMEFNKILNFPYELPDGCEEITIK